jgi:hypothetical protein
MVAPALSERTLSRTPHGGTNRPKERAETSHRRALWFRSQQSTSMSRARRIQCRHQPGRTRDGYRRKVPVQSFGPRNVESRLVAQPAAARAPASAFVEVRPDGRGLRLRARVREPRLQGAQEGPAQADDRLEAVVARGFRPLRSLVRAHGLAQRRHVSHR